MQKLAIISHLYRYMGEQGANEELLAIILNSLDDWDEKMQEECANAFIRPLKEDTVSEQNNQRILKQAIDILTNEEVASNKNLMTAWIDVFRNVVGKVKTNIVQQIALKPIQELLNKKHAMVKRQKGIELATAMAMNVKPSAHDDEPMFMKLIRVICSDTDYNIRAIGAKFFKDFFRSCGNEIAGTLHFENVLLPEIIELVNDEEAYVSVEALEGLLEVLEHCDVETIEEEIMPCVLKLIEFDNRIQEITVRMSEIIGKVVYKLSKTSGQLHKKYQTEFIAFYHRMCDDFETEDIRFHAAYNLPCFHICYRPPLEDEETKSDGSDIEIKTGKGLAPVDIDFNELYLRFANDDQQRIRETIASSLHEAFKLTGSEQDTSKLRTAFHDLLGESEKKVLVCLSTNLGKIVELYANDNCLDSNNGQINIRNGGRDSGDRSPNVFANSNRDLEPKRKKPVFLHSSTVGTKELDALVDSAKGGKSKDDYGFSSKAAGVSNGKRQLPTREVYEDNHSISSEYLILPEYQSEEVYSEVLHKLFSFNESLSSELSLWREHCYFLEQFASVVSYFHLPEAHDVFVDLLFSYIEKGNSLTKRAGATCLVSLVQHQYDSVRRQDLIKSILNDLAESNAFTYRKIFIFFCSEGAAKFSRQFFTDNFYKAFIELAHDPVPHVRLEFAKSLLQVLPLLETNQTLQFQLMDSLTKLRNDKDKDVSECSEHTEKQLLQRKKLPRVEFEAQEKQRLDLEKKLKQREDNELQERDRRMNMEEESKYDFGSYLLDKSKGLGRTKHNAGVSGRGLTTHGGKKGGFAGIGGIAQGSSGSKPGTGTQKASGQSTVSGFSNDKTPTKRKTGVTKRNSSALPNQLGDQLDQKIMPPGGNNAQRKASLLLPNGSSIIDTKGYSASGGPGTSGNIDNYKKHQYQLLVQQQSGQSQATGMGGYKRSNSLKVGGDSGSSSKVSKKTGKDTGTRSKKLSRMSSDEDNEEPKKGSTTQAASSTSGTKRPSAASAFSKKY